MQLKPYQIALSVIVLLLGVITALYAIINNDIEEVWLKATKYYGELKLDDTQATRELIEELEIANSELTIKEKETWYLLIVKREKGESRYHITLDGEIWREKESSFSLISGDESLRERLEQRVLMLSSINPYGELLEWEQSDELFPRFAKAKIIDLETQKSFMVQRRAGSRHADVQPLTTRDSKIMKEIYNGYWSWRRRAILVDTGERKIAASMNGMPHGAGAISGNDFNGHFCIHFFGCLTHSSHLDVDHQIMVWKAAGRFSEYLKGLTEEEYIKALMATVNQGDKGLFIQSVVIDGMEVQIAYNMIEDINVLKLEELEKKDNAQYTLKIALIKKNDNHQYKGTITINLVETQQGWRANAREVAAGVRQLITGAVTE